MEIYKYRCNLCGGSREHTVSGMITYSTLMVSKDSIRYNILSVLTIQLVWIYVSPNFDM